MKKSTNNASNVAGENEKKNDIVLEILCAAPTQINTVDNL